MIQLPRHKAKALFGLNIAVSMLSVIMGVVMLLLKSSLLRPVKREDTKSRNKEVEMSMDMVDTDNPLHDNDQVSNKT